MQRYLCLHTQSPPCQHRSSVASITGEFLPRTHPCQESFTPEVHGFLWETFWCCAFYRHGRMVNDTHASLKYHTEYFHHSKSPLCSAGSSLLPSHCWQRLTFFLPPGVTVPRTSRSSHIRVRRPSQTGFFPG